MSGKSQCVKEMAPWCRDSQEEVSLNSEGQKYGQCGWREPEKREEWREEGDQAGSWDTVDCYFLFLCDNFTPKSATYKVQIFNISQFL